MASPSTSVRYHDLDALRAFAMLLGIVLHGLLSFMEVPIWPAQDVNRDPSVYTFIQHGIHGFRLALFFLISGFFTTMLWRNRGLRPLVHHRIKRLLVPMLIATALVWPMLIGLAIWGGATKAELAKRQVKPTVFEAARAGALETLRQLDASGREVNQRNALGTTPLVIAALHGHAQVIDYLVEHDANVSAKTVDGSTSLHLAALFGRVEAVERLLAHGADATIRNLHGGTPLDNARVDWGIAQFAARALKVQATEATMQPNRERVANLLEKASGRSPQASMTAWDRLLQVIYIGSIIPVFHHLWFLYYLLWLLTGFVLVVWLVRKLGWPKFPVWMTTVTGCLILWLPLTFFAQLMMRQSFGPDTAPGLIPWPPKLLYYGLFFAYGALCYGRDQALERVGRRWILCFVLAIPVLITGVHTFEKQGATWSSSHLLAAVTAALYAWLMIFAFLGLFRRFFNGEHPSVRYLSDASYWLYLAHLPVIIALQIWVSSWPWPSAVKLLLVCSVTTALLMVVYRYLVRYSFIGTLLNGPRTRPQIR